MDEEDHIVSFALGRFHMGRRKAWAVTVFFFLCYFMLLPANIVSLNVFRDSFYICLVPVLVAAVLYERQLRDGTEYKLLFAFWVWFWLSRALNGSPTLDHDFDLFFDFSLMMPFFALGIALTRTERERFINWLSAVIGGFYFILGLFALSAFLRHSLYMLPLADAQIGIAPGAGSMRIIILNDDYNFIAFCYLISLFLMIYQFFHCEKKLWRVPILLSAFLDLLVIALLGSRSVWLCKALAFALLAAMLLMQWLQNRSRFLRVSVVFAAAVLVLIASYELSGLSSTAMTGLSYTVTDLRQAPAEARPQTANPTETEGTQVYGSIRPVFLSSGNTEAPEQHAPEQTSEYSDDVPFSRRQIWRGALQTIKANPSILWRGHLCDSIMLAAFGSIPSDGSGQVPWNFYNSLVQVLMTTGLPGLFLVISFLALVLYRGFRFSFCFSAPFALRTLVLPVVATMPYFMLEACLFSAIDVRTLFYFLMCGLIIGAERNYSDV